MVVEEEQAAPVSLVTHLYTLLQSTFPNDEVYINNRQIYDTNGLYAHKSQISNNFKGLITE